MHDEGAGGVDPVLAASTLAGGSSPLTAREREILQLVSEGNSSAQVAALLHLSTRTVDAHRFNVMQKLNIHSIAGLTKFAISHGLTSVR